MKPSCGQKTLSDKKEIKAIKSFLKTENNPCHVIYFLPMKKIFLNFQYAMGSKIIHYGSTKEHTLLRV